MKEDPPNDRRRLRLALLCAEGIDAGPSAAWVESTFHGLVVAEPVAVSDLRSGTVEGSAEPAREPGHPLGWPRFAGAIVVDTAPCAPPGPGWVTAQAASFRSAVPLDEEMPIALSSDLGSTSELEHFVDRFVGYHQVRTLFREGWTIADLVAFNVRERYRIIGHDPKKHRLIGRIVAKAKDHPRDLVAAEVASLFLTALEHPMTARKHLHVMEHVAEILESKLGGTARDEIRRILEAYAAGDAPRADAILLLRQQARACGVAGLLAQSYLFPHAVQETLLSARKG